MANSLKLSALLAILIVLPIFGLNAPAQAALDDIGDMAQEQAQEKLELEDMRNEMRDIKGQVKDAMGAMSQLTNPPEMAPGAGKGQLREVHLFAREASMEAGPEVAKDETNKETSKETSKETTKEPAKDLAGALKVLTYNGKIPGPEIHISEGDTLKIVLHNNLKTATSMHFHGMIAPQKVDGLPRAGNASTLPERFLKPEDTFIYQFVANQPGTFFYHPQIIHQEQRFKGMFGAIIVHPRLHTKAVNKEGVLFLSRQNGVYLINGKTAPYAPALEVINGDRVRLRVINVSDEAIPLHLGGHRLEITATNGSDPLEPKVIRDTITINPSDRVDIEFSANNPGVWSLASELPKQNSNNGKFPGGIAMIVRYTDTKTAN